VLQKLNSSLINLFRKIGYQLLGKNKTRKLLKYTVLEIKPLALGLGLGLGLLIALHINNWNENQKNKKQALVIVKNILCNLKKKQLI
jgi:hypothetical protein